VTKILLNEAEKRGVWLKSKEPDGESFSTFWEADMFCRIPPDGTKPVDVIVFRSKP